MKTRPSSFPIQFFNHPCDHQTHFTCLQNKNVISAKISDHHPVIHDGVLFWNMMMQGNERNRGKVKGFNNGLGLKETEEQYMIRLEKAAVVIAEMITFNPSIEIINLCEGPIKPLHEEILIDSFKKYPSMSKFFMDNTEDNFFHKPYVKDYSPWGLLMLADKKYQVNNAECDFIQNPLFIEKYKLANRFHVWTLTDIQGKNKHVALAHFPFSGDERKTEMQQLSAQGVTYCNLVEYVLNYYADQPLIFCADFNLNPYFLSEWKDREMDKITHHNSILLTVEEGTNKHIIDTVTVDGILLSTQVKQKYYGSQINMGLFKRLKKEEDLAQANNETLMKVMMSS